MDLTLITPRKRVLSSNSSESGPNDVNVDSTNPEAFSLFPDSKKFKTSHRWAHEDQGLVDRINEAALQVPRTPSARVARTTDEDIVTIITRKRKYVQYKGDLMEDDQSGSESDFQFPRVSTPDSVKGLIISRILEPEEIDEPTPSTSESTLVVDEWTLSDNNGIDAAYEFDSPALIATPLPDAPLPDRLLSDSLLTEGAKKSTSKEQSSAIDESHSSKQESEEEEISSWIRKKTHYGIVLAPQTDSGEQGYQTPDGGREYLIGDDDHDDSNAESGNSWTQDTPKNTHVWTEREEKVFRALVCDYGRNWERFLPFFPNMDISDDHYNDILATRPEYRLEEVADAAENGESFFSLPRRTGHWHNFASASDRLSFDGSSLPSEARTHIGDTNACYMAVFVSTARPILATKSLPVRFNDEGTGRDVKLLGFMLR